jgi:hypothetical protein
LTSWRGRQPLVCVFTLCSKGVKKCEDFERGAFHQFLNAGKKSITLDLELPNDSGLSTSFRRQPIS